jgi:hypothetical protein
VGTLEEYVSWRADATVPLKLLCCEGGADTVLVPAAANLPQLRPLWRRRCWQASCPVSRPARKLKLSPVFATHKLEYFGASVRYAAWRTAAV